MEKKLELIQQLAKAIARNALMVEHTVDVQLKAGQWTVGKKKRYYGRPPALTMI